MTVLKWHVPPQLEGTWFFPMTITLEYFICKSYSVLCSLKRIGALVCTDPHRDDCRFIYFRHMTPCSFHYVLNCNTWLLVAQHKEDLSHTHTHSLSLLLSWDRKLSCRGAGLHPHVPLSCHGCKHIGPPPCTHWWKSMSPTAFSWLTAAQLEKPAVSLIKCTDMPESESSPPLQDTACRYLSVPSKYSLNWRIRAPYLTWERCWGGNRGVLKALVSFHGWVILTSCKISVHIK